jgi:hypothetical protein
MVLKIGYLNSRFIKWIIQFESTDVLKLQREIVILRQPNITIKPYNYNGTTINFRRNNEFKGILYICTHSELYTNSSGLCL